MLMEQEVAELVLEGNGEAKGTGKHPGIIYDDEIFLGDCKGHCEGARHHFQEMVSLLEKEDRWPARNFPSKNVDQVTVDLGKEHCDFLCRRLERIAVIDGNVLVFEDMKVLGGSTSYQDHRENDTQEKITGSD